MQRDSLDKNIDVSVVMCTYNGASFVEEQLKTILQQTYPIKEILIHDDVSTDNTVEIIKRIAVDNPVIKLHINEVNIGYNRNFEKAFLAATGDAIAVADQDDIWLPTKIEKMIKAWKPGVPFIYCYSYLFDDSIPDAPTINPLFRRFEGEDARKLFMYNTVSGHTVLFRKEFLKKVLPFSDSVIYDWWMAVIACYNGGVQYLPEILVYQRIHDNNSTILHTRPNITKQYLMSRFKQAVTNTCLEFAKLPYLPNEHKKLAENLAKLISESRHHRFYKPLFYFLLKHRNLFFSNRKRAIPIFTQIKNSYRLATNEN